MVSATPEHHVRLPVLRAGWLRQAFVHWPFRPQDVQALLPPGLAPDVYGGSAWVSLTPFVMAGARPPGVPAGMRPSVSFPETNLRTYVRRPDGRDGLWFLSVEAASAAFSAAARAAVGAPYHPGRLRVSEHAGTVSYSGIRHGSGPRYRVVVRPGAPLRPSERDVWLTGRWRAWTRHLGVLLETPVEHEPWPLQEAVVEGLEETLTAAAGLPAPQEAPVAHFSPGVTGVRIGPTRPAPAGPRTAAARG